MAILLKSIFIALMILLIFLGILPQSLCAGEGTILKIGDPPPRVALPDLKGSLTIIPDAVKGKVVIIRFWADWCSACSVEMPALETLYRNLAPRGLVIIGINVGQTREKVSAFADRMKITYSLLLDSNANTANMYGVVGLPRTFILDRKGLIKYKLLGDIPSETVRTLVLKIL